MTDKSRKLSSIGHALLTVAATRDDHLVPLPRLPVAAARPVVRSLLYARSIEEVPAPTEDADYAWRTGEDGGVLMLRATTIGLARRAEPGGIPPSSVSIKPEAEVPPERTEGTVAVPEATGAPLPPSQVDSTTSEGEAAQGPQARAGEAPQEQAGPVVSQAAALVEPRRAGRPDPIRQVAEALLAAWGQTAAADEGFAQAMREPIADLRNALLAKRRVSAAIDPARMPRDTKQAQVLAMLRCKEGASGPQIASATGWAPHTVRGFLAGLGKKGINIAVLERVRQVGPNKTGAKGSYTVYHLVGEAQA